MHHPIDFAATEHGLNSRATLCSAAALYLMSRYTQSPCPLLAHAIADQLQRLAHLPATAANNALRTLACALLPRWQAIAGAGHSPVRH